MVKNIIIAVLAIACGVLGYMQFGMQKPVVEVPAPEEQAVASEPLSAVELVQFAEVEGLSLLTPLDGVDEIVKTAGYECNKSENKVSKEGVNTHDAYWRCTHTTLDRTTLNITAKGGEIRSIGRNGKAMVSELDGFVDYVSALKNRLNSNEGLSFSQNYNRTNMQLSYRDDAGSHFLRYTSQYNRSPDLDLETQPAGTFGVSLSR